MNGAVAHAERRIPALAAVEVGFLVGRRKPISELPPEKQAQIRKAYEDTYFCSDTCLELFGFFTDLEAAEEQAARHPGGFVMSLPVNGCRPDELGRYGTQLFPNSDNRRWYEETSPNLVHTTGADREELEAAHRAAKRLTEELQSIAS